MAKSWQQVTQLPEFQSLSDEDKERARDEYFYDVIAPTAKSYDEIDQLRADFDAQSMPEPKTVPERTWGEAAKDTGIDVAKGVIGVGESAVGLTDIATGNAAGHALAGIGYNPGRAKDMLSSGYSESRKAQNQSVEEAKGFTNTLIALVNNPQAAFGTIAESAPMMVGTMAIARAAALRMLSANGLRAGTPEAAAFLARRDVAAKLATASAGAEGAMSAGQTMETARQAGRDWGDSVLPSIASGIGTAAIGKLSSKILPDVEATTAAASLGNKQRVQILQAGKEIAKGAIKEGILEEMPQSAQEQVFTNLALGRPWNEGVQEAAAQGLVAGTGMGLGMSSYNQVAGGISERKGPMTRAVNTGVQSGAYADGNDAGLSETGQEPVQPTPAEPKADIEAQVEDMLNPDTPRDSVFIGRDSAPPENMPADALVVESERGTLVTTNPEKAAVFEQSQTDDALAAILGHSMSPRQVEAAATVGDAPVSLVVTDDAGRTVHAETVPESVAPEVAAKLEAVYPGRVSAVPVEQLAENRRSRIESERIAATQLQAEQDFIAQQSERGQQMRAEAERKTRETQQREAYKAMMAERDKVIQALMPEGVDHMVSRNGEPFVDAETARQAAINRGIADNTAVVPHAGGFAIVEMTDDQKAEQARIEGEFLQQQADLRDNQIKEIQALRAKHERAKGNPNPADVARQKIIDSMPGDSVKPATRAPTETSGVDIERRYVDVRPKDKKRTPAERVRIARQIDWENDDLEMVIRKLGGIDVRRSPDWRGRLSHLDGTRDLPFGLTKKIERTDGSGLSLEELTEYLAQSDILDLLDETGAYDSSKLAEYLDQMEQGPVWLKTSDPGHYSKDGMTKEEDREQYNWQLQQESDSRNMSQADEFEALQAELESVASEYYSDGDHALQTMESLVDAARKVDEALAEEIAMSTSMRDSEIARKLIQLINGEYDGQTGAESDEKDQGAGREVPAADTGRQSEGRLQQDEEATEIDNAGPPEPGDILKTNGQPFASIEAAERARENQRLDSGGVSHETVPVVDADGNRGFALRPSKSIETKANEAATSPANDLPEPTEAQKEAGNYKKGRVTVNGTEIAIENPAGSKRRPEWPALKDHYGDFKRTMGAEGNQGEGVDVFINSEATDAEVESRPVFVVDQHNKDGSFDEHKTILGATDEAHAMEIYKRNYEKGWDGGKAVTRMEWDEFKAWAADSKNTSKPASQETDDLGALREAYKRADKSNDLAGIMKIGAKIKAALASDAKERINNGQMVIIQSGDIYKAVHPSTRNPGQYQVTRYNNTGALGDSNYTSIDSLLDDEITHRSELIDTDKVEAVLSSLSKAEGEYQAGAKQKPATVKNQMTVGAEQNKASGKSGNRQGKVGDMLSSGEVVLTATGRQTTPFPTIKTGPRNTEKTVKAAERWLIQNAIDEAISRGDKFNQRGFESALDNPQQADKDSAEYYLFDKDFIQPIQKQFTKPLVDKVDARQQDTKPVVSNETPVGETQIDEETLKNVGLLRQYGERWQYKFSVDAGFMTANTKEAAIERATEAYQKTPAEKLLTKQQRFDKANEDEYAKSHRQWGNQSDQQLQDMYEKLGGDIKSLRAAGKNEMNEMGGRRTSAAVSNEGARNAAETRMRLARYIQERAKRNNKPATEKKLPKDKKSSADQVDEFNLTPPDVDQLNADAKARAEQEKAEQAKAEADAMLGDFALAGSDRKADANANQADIVETLRNDDAKQDKGIALSNIVIRQELLVDGKPQTVAINADIAVNLARDRLDDLANLRNCVRG